MSIVQSVPNSFKKELLEGKHDFTTSTGSTFKIALYDSTASLTQSTTAYTATGEVTGTGYTAGGATLTNVTPVIASGVAYVDFADVTWSSSTITARGALIYNSSQSNAAVLVLDFGVDRSSSASDFTVTFPTAGAISGIIRIG
jgi:hypothetical protein